MKVFTRNLETSNASATIRMTKHELRALREFLHIPEDVHQVKFTYGAQLLESGFGWYKIVAFSEFRVAEQVAFALKQIRLYQRWLKAELIRELQKALPQDEGPVVSETKLITIQETPEVRRVEIQVRTRPSWVSSPSQQKLAQLAAKFARR